MILEFLKKHWTILLGIPVGAIGGFLYWQQIGCTSGTCPITSNPYNSTIYGAVMGGLIFSNFNKRKNTDENSKVN